MMYKTESEMYPDVVAWLEKLLKVKYPRANIVVADTSRLPLNDFIARQNLQAYFKPEWVTYDLRVDVTGIVIAKNVAQLAFVECKLPATTLANVSQLLGYSRIALPQFSFLVSPQGFSDAVLSLIKTYARRDILEYYWEKGKPARSVILATWNPIARQIEPSSVLPTGAVTWLGVDH